MLNFLVFHLHTPELLCGLWGDYSAVTAVCRVWPYFWTCLSITVRHTLHLQSSSLSGTTPHAAFQCHVLRAEEQLQLPRAFLEWEVKPWSVDCLKHVKPWDPLVFLLRGCLLSPMSHGLPIVLGRAKCGVPDGELGWPLPVPSLSDHVNKRRSQTVASSGLGLPTTRALRSST